MPQAQRTCYRRIKIAGSCRHLQHLPLPLAPHSNIHQIAFFRAENCSPPPAPALNPGHARDAVGLMQHERIAAWASDCELPSPIVAEDVREGVGGASGGGCDGCHVAAEGVEGSRHVGRMVVVGLNGGEGRLWWF